MFRSSPPPPTTATLNVIKTTQCDEGEFGDICAFNPLITVTDDNPTPSSFPASDTPQVVTLGAGQYNVIEEGFVTGLAECAGFEGGQRISNGNFYACADFSEDCSGDISAGESLSCEITNTVIEGPTGTLHVTKLVTCADENGENSPSCEELLATITEDQFRIQVLGFSPDPSSPFPGSENGTNVTLGIDNYQVLDLPQPSIATDKEDLGGNITGPIASFTGNCQQNAPDSALGTITVAGESQTCNIENHFVIEEDAPPPTETLTVIKNVKCQADNQTCAQNPLQPSNFTVVIDGNNPSQNNFPGSSGTDVELEPGAYNVTEQGLDPVTPAICSTMGFEAGQVVSPNTSGLFICTNISDECEGDITIGNPQTCTIENVLVEKNLLDLAVANFFSNNVSILLGTGTGTFGNATNFAVGSFPNSVAVGDFNGDTRLDLAVAIFGSDNVSILLGTGTGTFGTCN